MSRSDNTLGFELPPGEATLRCRCGFESEPFCFVEHLYRCCDCRTVDRPAKVPFLYLPPKCSKCNRQFERCDRIHAAWMSPCDVLAERIPEDSPDFTLCPRCGENSLALNGMGVDYEVIETDHVTPAAGATIHARTMRDPTMKSDRPELPFFLWSPRLSPELSVSFKIVNGNSSLIGDGHHEFRIIAVSQKVPKLELEYVRQLKPDEWQWFAGPNRIAT